MESSVRKMFNSPYLGASASFALLGGMLAIVVGQPAGYILLALGIMGLSGSGLSQFSQRREAV
jgi:hypothetical protein